jgi:hypothetical protein
LPLQAAVAPAHRQRPVILLSLLCLDAPLVAVAWQWIIARNLGEPLNLPQCAVLFLVAWLIYLSDRLADSFTVPPCAPTSARQRFCRQYRFIIVPLIVLLGITDTILSLTLIDRRTFISGALIFGATSIYLAINHFASGTWRHVPVKEAAIGFLFALGTVAVINQKSTNLLVVLMLFGLLCSLNCLSISVWERDLDIAQGRESFATAHPKRKSLPAMSCWILSVIGTALLIDSKLRLFAFCLASSALLLALLHRVGRIDRDERVALADLVLLTPAVVFLFYCSHIR